LSIQLADALSYLADNSGEQERFCFDAHFAIIALLQILKKMKKAIVLGLHASYWLIYLLMLTAMLIAQHMGHPPESFGVLVRALFLSGFGIGTVVPGIIGFYGFYSGLFRFLGRKDFIRFSIGALCVCVFAAIATEALMYVVTYGRRVHPDWSAETCISMGLFIGFIASVNGIIALIMKGFITWYKEMRLKEELAAKNFQMELDLLKSRINPHFLFNTINNIDGLIIKDAPKASEYLNRLSEIMRFMLYRTDGPIALVEELDYIEKYLDLQKIRSTNPSFVSFKINGDAADKTVEPMVFVPFIENAFKYSGDKKQENAVEIAFQIEEHTVRFTCKNRLSDKMRTETAGGLGNNLILRRLELLYPQRHNITTSEDHGTYMVDLTLKL
jgi:two-component system, LytTR family, sensor kinase